jgi:hypothetical protein
VNVIIFTIFLVPKNSREWADAGELFVPSVRDGITMVTAV